MNGAHHTGQRSALQGAHYVVWMGMLLLTLAGCAFPFGGSTSRAPASTATPRPLTPEETAGQMVAQMSLDEKLGQMLIMQLFQPTYTPTQHQMVESFHPGGILLFRSAMGTAQQLKTLLASGQRDSTIPLFTFVDDEGGQFDPLVSYSDFSLAPSSMTATGNPTVAQSQGGKTATDLLSFGFNADLAPNLNLANGGADTRSFGATSEQVTTYGGAWLTGLQANGVLGCAIDFPSLTGKVDLAPYRTLIQSGQLQMIMTTSAVIPALDPSLPATLSKSIVTGLLRNGLQFSGVVITDALVVTSVSKRFSLPQAAVMAIEAGADMINGVWDPTSMHDVISALKAAIAAGALSEQQVDAAVTRILALKLRYHIVAAPNSAATHP